MNHPTPLLAAKLTPPPPRPGLVARAHLERRLDEAGARVLLVVAPPGFGKTTLLASWLRGLAGRHGRPAARVAWLALDERDNDPARFWLHLIGAIDRAAPGVGEHARSMMGSPTPPPVEVTIAALLEDLAGAPGEHTLVLDDYHAVVEPAIHAGVAFLIDSLPPNTRLAVAGRAEPPLPLARLRLRGQLVELRAPDLRFSPDEADQLLRGQGLALPPDEVAALEARTEGWAGALQLAALSLREAPGTGAQIAAFAGSNRHLVDYLADEVLRRQDAPTRRFLLATCVLDQLCAELCDAVLVGEGGTRGQGDKGARGHGDATVPSGQASETLPTSPNPPVRAAAGRSTYSAGTLEQLERDGLFLLPLDQERRWFRYHSLFAAFLRARLERDAPGQAAELHRRAAAWYAGNGLPVEAVGHLLAAGDTARAAALVEQEGRALLLRSEVATVLGWLAALPPAATRARPALCLIEAWARALAGQFDAVEPPLQAVEGTLDAYAGDPDAPAAFSAPYTPRNLRSEALAVRATVAGLRREVERAVELGRAALAALPDDSVIVRAVVALMLGNSAYLAGRLDEAAPALEEAARAGEISGMPLVAVFALRQLGEVRGRAGQLHRAAATYQAAIDLGARLYPGRPEAAPRPVPVAGAAYVPLGLLHYEWDDLPRAAVLLADGMELGRQGQNVEILLMGPIGMARVQAARGDAAAAREAMRRAVAYARATGVPRLLHWLSAEQARLALTLGDVGEAAAWDQERRLDSEGPLSYLEEIDFLTLARLRVEQGHPRDALRLLGRLRDLAERQNRGGSLVEIDALDALAYRAAGDVAAARASLLRSLARGAPEGYVRTFVDLGEPMARLLADVAGAKSAHAAYARRLLDAYNAAAPGPLAPPGPVAVRRPAVAALDEQPTPRELEVLGWVAAGLTNEQIAEQLVVGLSTVKKHINNLYAKLGVATRTQALRRARELGLLE